MYCVLYRYCYFFSMGSIYIYIYYIHTYIISYIYDIYIYMYIYKYIYNHCGISPMQQESSDPEIRHPQELDRLCQPEISEEVPAPPCFGPSGGGGPVGSISWFINR